MDLVPGASAESGPSSHHTHLSNDRRGPAHRGNEPSTSVVDSRSITGPAENHQGDKEEVSSRQSGRKTRRPRPDLDTSQTAYRHPHSRGSVRRNDHVHAPATSPSPVPESTSSSRGTSSSRQSKQWKGNRRQPKLTDPTNATASNPNTTNSGSTKEEAASDLPQRPRGGRRGAKFSAGLSEPSGSKPIAPSLISGPSPRRSAPKNDDLTSSLIRSLSTPPYPECLICFVPIHPAQPTWSCSPPSAVPSEVNVSNEELKLNRDENNHCCWKTFHLKCIRSWASKSVKEVAEAWRARGEERSGEWRCPGCQTKREIVPNGYWCFCGSTPEPKLTRLSTPHSCGNHCSRLRICRHPCPLPCHPGPCSPCQVSAQLPCHCGKEILSFKCQNLSPKNAGLTNMSCGAVCGKKLGCGNHVCQNVCHPGDCEPCAVMENVRCYCGKTRREVGCGEGKTLECHLDQGDHGRPETWVGRFACETICERPFNCGKHFCTRTCHHPSASPPVCPLSPSLVTHCPCGKHSLSPDTANSFPSNANLSRISCSDPIPTCNSICMKPLDGCSHVCSLKCHSGPCPPCSIMLVRPCRCGSTTRDVQCSIVQKGEVGEVLCDRPCTALRACGRHQCNRICCPLASLAGAAKGKNKRRMGAEGVLDVLELNQAGLHECDLVCGKMLPCGNHTCEAKDHRGPCPSCLRSTYEEMICHCGRTVLEPPIPCGTRIKCTYSCTRPPPPCGHQRTQHSCHEDPIPCPPCPFLTSKPCACGKKEVANVKCFQEKVSCGTTCGKLLACGFHHCERPCHGDDCGPCSSVCGKSRRLCFPNRHPCTLPCHAPTSCSEVEPCTSMILLTCPCGRITQSVKCGRCTANPAGREAHQQLQCSNECNIAKRNARLAEALGISTDRQETVITYSDRVVAFARVNAKFLSLVEKAFTDFIKSDKNMQVLPEMPLERRRFVHELATVYRMDTQMVDQEPHRSVQLIRRVDTRIPPTLLSSSITPAPPSLGKLADLRAAASQPPKQTPTPEISQAPGSIPVSSVTGVTRGWTSIVMGPPVVGTARGGTYTPPSRRSTPSNNTVHVESPMPAVRDEEANVPANWEDDS